MKTFADVKRRAVVGATLELEYAEGFAVLSKKGNPPARKIAVKQTNAIAFEPCDWSGGKESWLWWPKASEIRIIDADTFELVGLGRYHFVG
jgi:hypothetical protein